MISDNPSEREGPDGNFCGAGPPKHAVGEFEPPLRQMVFVRSPRGLRPIFQVDLKSQVGRSVCQASFFLKVPLCKVRTYVVLKGKVFERVLAANAGEGIENSSSAVEIEVVVLIHEE